MRPTKVVSIKDEQVPKILPILTEEELKERESKIEDLLSFVCEIADKNTEKDCRKNFNVVAAVAGKWQASGSRYVAASSRKD